MHPDRRRQARYTMVLLSSATSKYYALAPAATPTWAAQQAQHAQHAANQRTAGCPSCHHPVTLAGYLGWI